MELTHILAVSDLPRSVRWYRDVLGATLTGEYGGTSAVFNYARFLTEPNESAWEVRCFFRDPDGHLFEISERKA